MTALRAACKKLVEAIDRREKHGHELIERRRDEPVSLDAMREWPEHREWQRAIADEKDAQSAIRAALAEEKVEKKATPAPAFKVGDRVRVNRGMCIGLSGSIESIDHDRTLPFSVLFDGRKCSVDFARCELSPAEVRT